MSTADDRARAVKDQTLGMEIVHAQRLGGTLRDAEDANAKALQRLEARKREGVPRRQTKAELRAERKRLLAERRERQATVTVRPAPVIAPPKLLACGRCGMCLHCRREIRVAQILRTGGLGDTAQRWLALNLTALLLAKAKRTDCRIAQTRRSRPREVGFSRMKRRERNVAFLSAVSEICDWSVRWFGPWR